MATQQKTGSFRLLPSISHAEEVLGPRQCPIDITPKTRMLLGGSLKPDQGNERENRLLIIPLVIEQLYSVKIVDWPRVGDHER